MDIYKSKYLKYKNKYLKKLVNPLEGGGVLDYYIK